MRVKICGVKSDADLDAVVQAGADAVGFLVGQIHASTDFILAGTAARLASRLPPFVTPVLVTHLIKAADVLKLVETTHFTTIQLHGAIPAAQIAKLKAALGHGYRLLKAVNFSDGMPPPDIFECYPLLDAVLLDSHDKSTGAVGGTGLALDWVACCAFVKACPLPVVLAGGLRPDNVVVAIQACSPYAVDANSGLKGPDGAKDPARCAAFVRQARTALDAKYPVA